MNGYNPDTEGSAYARIYREQKAPFSTPNNAPAVPDSQTLLVRRPPTAESLADLRNPSADPFNPAVVYQQPQLRGQGGAPYGGSQYGGYGNEGSYRQGGPLHSGNQQLGGYEGGNFGPTGTFTQSGLQYTGNQQGIPNSGGYGTSFDYGQGGFQPAGYQGSILPYGGNYPVLLQEELKSCSSTSRPTMDRRAATARAASRAIPSAYPALEQTSNKRAMTEESLADLRALPDQWNLVPARVYIVSSYELDGPRLRDYSAQSLEDIRALPTFSSINIR